MYDRNYCSTRRTSRPTRRAVLGLAGWPEPASFLNPPLAPLDGAKALVDGCGIGMYVRALRQAGVEVWGLDIEHEHAVEALANAPGSGICQAAGEHLPYPDGTFDWFSATRSSSTSTTIASTPPKWCASCVRLTCNRSPEKFLHPTPYALHLPPAAAPSSSAPTASTPSRRTATTGGGQYHFGNTPFVNWLPDPLRDRLAPHVRAYTKAGWRHCSRICPCASCTIARSTPATTMSSLAGLR